MVNENDLDKIDRNARAYGYEIGRGASIAKQVETSEDNPFLNPNWREALDPEEATDHA